MITCFDNLEATPFFDCKLQWHKMEEDNDLHFKTVNLILFVISKVHLVYAKHLPFFFFLHSLINIPEIDVGGFFWLFLTRTNLVQGYIAGEVNKG